MESSYLVLVRHGQSEWNEKNLFTGWKDPKLTARGVDEAIKAGKELKEAGYSDQQINSIHGPIGIKLGGRSAPEIALSIIAQLVSEVYKK